MTHLEVNELIVRGKTSYGDESYISSVFVVSLLDYTELSLGEAEVTVAGEVRAHVTGHAAIQHLHLPHVFCGKDNGN